MTPWGRVAGVVVLAALAVCAVAGSAWARPGDLDRSYGVGTGFSRIDFSGLVAGATASRDSASALALQSDGKIVVAGTTNATGVADMAVVRLNNPQGTLDASYGLGTGGSRIDFSGLVPGATGHRDSASAVALGSDGKIVVAGGTSAAGTEDMAVVRLNNPEGTLDSTYGLGTGGSRIDFAALGPGLTSRADSVSAMALQPDGKIVLAGLTFAASATSDDMAVVRLNNPQGTIDTSYGLGTGGSRIDFRALVPGATPSNDVANALALQPDGKIVLAGTTDAAGGPDMAVARLNNPQGTLDSSYGLGTGASRIDLRALVPGPGASNDFAHAVAVQPDGKIVVAGTSNANGSNDFAVVRLNNPAGTLDGTFGTNGATLTSLGADDDAAAVAIQPDGKIVVAGTVDQAAGGQGDIGVERLQPNGTPDSSFGNGGKAVIDLGDDEQVSAMALQRDGRIVVAGTRGSGETTDMFVARLEGDPGAGAGGGGSGGGAGGGSGSAGGGGSPPRCAGKRATIVGTSGKDRLRGTRKADVIVALGGNDTISAAGGNDLVCAGGGNDKVDASSGNDRVYGQGGKDKVSGGAGNDLLDGGASNDRLFGQGGKDRIAGGSGNDLLDGGAGNDRLSGQSGKDKLLGRGGRDRLSGGPGRDSQRQ